MNWFKTQGEYDGSIESCATAYRGPIGGLIVGVQVTSGPVLGLLHSFVGMYRDAQGFPFCFDPGFMKLFGHEEPPAYPEGVILTGPGGIKFNQAVASADYSSIQDLKVRVKVYEKELKTKKVVTLVSFHAIKDAA